LHSTLQPLPPAHQQQALDTLLTDLSLLKKTVISLTSKLSLQDEKLASLEQEVEHLKRENLKLTTDVKVVRNELLMEQVNLGFFRRERLLADEETLRRGR
jgi:cell division protein FtsB